MHLTSRFNETSLSAARRTQAQSVAAWTALKTARMKTAKKGDISAAKKELKRLSLQYTASPFVLTQLFAGVGGLHEIAPMDTLHGISGLCAILRFFLDQFGNAEVWFVFQSGNIVATYYKSLSLLRIALTRHQHIN